METEVIYQNNFQKEYFQSDTNKKIDIILLNYSTFENQLNIIKNGIKYDIKISQSYKKHSSKSDTGIRVMTSSLSNPTLNEAVQNYEIDEAFDKDDLEGILAKTDDPQIFKYQWIMLKQMSDDYYFVKTIIDNICDSDKETLRTYLNYQRSITFKNLSSSDNVELRSIYQRKWRFKNKIKSKLLDGFNRKYGRNQ